MLRGLTTVAYLADDLDEAKAWYSALFGVEPYFQRPEYIEWRLGDYQHEFGILNRKYSRAEPGAQPRKDPAGATVYWAVDDLNAALERLTAHGATLLDPPQQFGEGFVGASVIDPFGNILGVMFNQHYVDVLAQRSSSTEGVEQA
ncbi:MAG: VOC family protein [Chloroflexi bacterium]|nr:VOC family protein [Chloroflexota bacterium]